MSLTVFFFYIFAALLTFSALMVISSKNPVHGVLFLIFSFFNAAGLFVLLGAEFLAMILVVVYVGAVAVLFLFVVMMLDVDFAQLRAGFMKHFWLGLGVGGVALAELIYVVGSWSTKSAGEGAGVAGAAGAAAAGAAAAGAGATTTTGGAASQNLTNTDALGRILYTKHVFFFEVAGLILLVALIGAIILTLHKKEGVKRQSIADQVARGPLTSVEIIKVPSGKAVFPTTRADAGE